VHLVGRQLARDDPHLLVDVVLPDALCKGCQLTFDVLGVLASQRRRSDLVTLRAMTR
jgi:hypothetical protein